MRTLRLILYFFVGFALSAIVVPAFAEDYPAVFYWQVGPYKDPDLLTACRSQYPATEFVTQVAPHAGQCNFTKSDGSIGVAYPASGLYWCLGGGTLWDVNGVQMCTNAPACTPPQVRDSTTGQCKVASCPSAGTGTGLMSPSTTPVTNPDLANSYAWSDPGVTAKAYGAGGTFCSGGCVVAFQSALCILPVADNYNCAVLNTSYTGATCSTSGPPSVVPGGTADTPKSPPCDPGQSIIQMGGKLACLPSGQSPDTPKVTESSSTKTYPDGSTKVTTTTQTCNGAGACSSTTTVTNTTATSGPNAGGAGQAGKPGTTTDEEDESDDTSEFCAKNPSLQVCKGGIAEEGTQKQVLAEVKKLSSVDSSTDKSAITNTKSYTSTEGYEAAKAKDDELLNFANGATKNAAVEASKTTFEQAVASGFWTDIPTASCTTPTYSIAGHAIEWSRWCEIVGYIQEIGAYGMWIMLAISVFVMLTGGRQS